MQLWFWPLREQWAHYQWAATQTAVQADECGSGFKIAFYVLITLIDRLWSASFELIREETGRRSFEAEHAACLTNAGRSEPLSRSICLAPDAQSEWHTKNSGIWCITFQAFALKQDLLFETKLLEWLDRWKVELSGNSFAFQYCFRQMSWIGERDGGEALKWWSFECEISESLSWKTFTVGPKRFPRFIDDESSRHCSWQLRTKPTLELLVRSGNVFFQLPQNFARLSIPQVHPIAGRN